MCILKEFYTCQKINCKDLITSSRQKSYIAFHVVAITLTKLTFNKLSSLTNDKLVGYKSIMRV